MLGALATVGSMAASSLSPISAALGPVSSLLGGSGGLGSMLGGSDPSSASNSLNMSGSTFSVGGGSNTSSQVADIIKVTIIAVTALFAIKIFRGK